MARDKAGARFSLIVIFVILVCNFLCKSLWQFVLAYVMLCDHARNIMLLLDGRRLGSVSRAVVCIHVTLFWNLFTSLVRSMVRSRTKATEFSLVLVLVWCGRLGLLMHAGGSSQCYERYYTCWMIRCKGRYYFALVIIVFLWLFNLCKNILRTQNIFSYLLLSLCYLYI